MVDNIRIAPSILAVDFTRLGAQVRAAADAGADYIHIDVMDGQFVPNITMGVVIVEAVRRITSLPLDVHLMIVKPERHLKAFAEAGADILSVHVEACPNLHSTLMQIHDSGCKAGVAINPHTPAVMLSEVMHMVDMVNVMTVNPGFGGQHFLPETLPKIRHLRTMIAETGRSVGLEVDGGVMVETAPQVIQAGADVLIAGSSVFNNERTVKENIAALRAAVNQS